MITVYCSKLGFVILKPDIKTLKIDKSSLNTFETVIAKF